jgi:serine/threonine protein kinase
VVDPNQGKVAGGVGATRVVNVPFQPIRFGKYFLLDKVAIGGMAEIFRAKSFGHSGFEKVVVIKRILSQFAHNDEFVEMFIDEAKLSVELTHPNIVQIYDFGKIDDSLFIAMESVQGKDLRSVLRRLAERTEYMPHEVAAFIAHEMACGLDFAHKKTDHIGLPLNIVHRDISPSNVLISYGGHIKVVDFGIAKAESASDATESGVLKGKFQYMSPEQASAAPVDHRSDVFSLGICLWEMLTGNRLFKRKTGLESLDAVRSGEVPTPSSFNPSVPEELEQICMHALSADLGQRYQEACHMQADLQNYLLPHTPSSLAPHVSTWLRGRFGEEILRERERLDRGTELVTALKDGDELTFGGSSRSDSGVRGRRGGSHITQTRKRKKRKKQNYWLILAGSGVIALLTLLLIGVLLVPLMNPEPAANGLGTLIIDVSPTGIQDVEILLDGQPIRAHHDTVQPGVPHQLVVNAPGYRPATKSGLELEPGQSYRFEMRLELEPLSSLDLGGDPEGSEQRRTSEGSKDAEDARAEPARESQDTSREPTAEPVPRPAKRATSNPAASGAFLNPNVTGRGDASKPPTIAFRSNPSGARVFVDGRRQGTTPFSWRDGDPDKLYKIEFRKDGYNSIQAAVNAPKGGLHVLVERSLQRRIDASAGTLSVSVSAGYARVFVDGEFVNTTPLVGLELSSGKHQVRVANPLEELDLTETVTIRAGRHTEKLFQVEQ